MKHSVLSTILLLTMCQIALADSRAEDEFQSKFREAIIYKNGNQISTLAGARFSTGLTADESASKFLSTWSRLFNVESSDLVPRNWVGANSNSVLLGFDQATENHNLQVLQYQQTVDGLPVFESGLKLILGNTAGYPVIMVRSSLKDLRLFALRGGWTHLDPKLFAASFRVSGRPDLDSILEAEAVVWPGSNDMRSEPTVAMSIVLTNHENSGEAYLFIVNPISGEIIYQRDLRNFDNHSFTGHVRARVKDADSAISCAPYSGEAVPTDWSALVYTGGQFPVYVDEGGFYSLSTTANFPITLTSHVSTRWFHLWDEQIHATHYLEQQFTIPGSYWDIDFLHNSGTTDSKLVAVNAIYHLGRVRKEVLMANQGYPGINRESMVTRINVTDEPCPNNAWFASGDMSLNFCAADEGFANAVNPDVIFHEYAHYLIHSSGSGQLAYGEGMSDALALVMTERPQFWYGGNLDCTYFERNALGEHNYPCTAEDGTYGCGQILSGCLWDLRSELTDRYTPTLLKRNLMRLLVDSFLERPYGDTTVTPEVYLEFLIADDDDANLQNGTPHFCEIHTAFLAHNMVPTPNPVPDTDSDGLLDPCDNCVSVANPTQTDSDDDDAGDACDNCQGLSNPTQANDDSDQFGNACDNCPTVANNDQLNSDVDTPGDACDNCPSDTNPDQTDGDQDGVGDVCDNCPEVANTNQMDSNNNDIGDACEFMMKFGGEILLSTGGTPQFVYAGDFDGDHDNDIVAGRQNYLYFFWNNGNLTFSSSTPLSFSDYLTDAAVGKFNADTLVDVAVISTDYYVAEYVHILMSNGDRTFTTTQQFDLSDCDDFLIHISANDMNFDGDIDLQCLFSGNGYWYPQFGETFLTNSGTGSFTPDCSKSKARESELVDCPVTFESPYADHFTDLDGDNLPEELWGIQDPDFPDVLAVFCSRPWPLSDVECFLHDVNGINAISSADFDSDGDRDIVAVHGDPAGVSVMRNDGEAHLELYHRVTIPLANTDVETGDLDLDGDADIIVDGALILENDSLGNFPKQGIYGQASADCFIAYIGPDQRNDLVKSAPTGVQVSFGYKCGDANGDGIMSISDAVFMINYIFDGGPAPEPMRAGDADCNGRMSISDAVKFINWAFGGGSAPCSTCQ